MIAIHLIEPIIEVTRAPKNPPYVTVPYLHSFQVRCPRLRGNAYFAAYAEI